MHSGDLDTKPFIDRILAHIDYETLQVADPAALPTCPYCGAPLFVAFRAGRIRPTGCELSALAGRGTGQKPRGDGNWRGFNTPGVIRWPFERLVNIHKNVTFIRINSDYRNYANTARPEIPNGIRSKSASINADAGEIIEALHDRLKGDGIHQRIEQRTIGEAPGGRLFLSFMIGDLSFIK